MKPLTLEETRLKEEMKERCLNKGQYIDEKAKAKFKMLCHLEDFEVQYKKLQQENKQLKDNWNKLKEYCQDNSFMQNTREYGTLTVVDADELAIYMEELESGDNNK